MAACVLAARRKSLATLRGYKIACIVATALSFLVVLDALWGIISGKTYRIGSTSEHFVKREGVSEVWQETFAIETLYHAEARIHDFKYLLIVLAPFLMMVAASLRFFYRLAPAIEALIRENA
jgi:hypothetical protein